jgi:hypothetical protein
VLPGGAGAARPVMPGRGTTRCNMMLPANAVRAQRRNLPIRPLRPPASCQRHRSYRRWYCGVRGKQAYRAQDLIVALSDTAAIFAKARTRPSLPISSRSPAMKPNGVEDDRDSRSGVFCRCGARCRSGLPCCGPAMRNGRCRMHGEVARLRHHGSPGDGVPAIPISSITLPCGRSGRCARANSKPRVHMGAWG